MALETSKFDVLYGRLLGKGLTPTLAKQLAATLYALSEKINVSIDDLIRHVGVTGIKFDNHIYDELNRYRSNSSQIGYLDPANVPRAVAAQVPTVFIPGYMESDYVQPNYVE